mmetsp:Transcript_39454/g.105868  ORF Transcript_39454/g.105868 Transcript_39454/m.105868 type:complete len:333 (-) Transcript_39454:492-1490(-)
MQIRGEFFLLQRPCRWGHGCWWAPRPARARSCANPHSAAPVQPDAECGCSCPRAARGHSDVARHDRHGVGLGAALRTQQPLALPHVLSAAAPELRALEPLHQVLFLVRCRCRRRQGSPCGRTSLEHVVLHVEQELLLGAQHAARPARPDPADEGSCWELEVLHRIEPDERAGSAQTSLAVHRDGTRLALHDAKEFADDFWRGAGAVREEEIHMLDTLIDEGLRVVLLLVQSNNQADAGLVKHWCIIFRGERWIPVCVDRTCRGRSKCQELAGDDPVHVAVLAVCEVVVGVPVEAPPVEPPEVDGSLEATQAVQQGAVVGARATEGVAVRREL